MEKRELFDFLITKGNNPSGCYTKEKYFKTHWKEIYDGMVEYSSLFGDEFHNMKFIQKLYHFLQDDVELKIGLCEHCGLHRCAFDGFSLGYKRFCCVECKNESISVRNKISTTKANWTKEQTKQFKSNLHKSLAERTEEDKRISNIKREETCISKYGVKSISQLEETKNKVKNKILSKTEEEITQSKNKRKNTIEKKYGSEKEFHQIVCDKRIETYNNKSQKEKEEIKNKRKKTNLLKYGVGCNLNTKETKERFVESMIDKYGSMEEYYKIHGQKIKDSWLSKSNDDKDKIRKKIKETNISKYGVGSFFQTDEFKEYVKKYNLDKYGVDYYTQSNEYHKNKRHSFKSNLTGELFDSNWEIKIAEYCFLNDIEYEYQPNIGFEYTCCDKVHKYQPDFLINGKLYETKGDHFFENGKMINPYDRSQDDVYEAKHQCMLKNNVIILKEKDIKNLKNIFHK